MKSPMEPVDPLVLRKLLAMLARQFGNHLSTYLEGQREKLAIERSKNTNKIRYLFLDGKMVFVLRPEPGFFSLTIHGGQLLHDLEKKGPMRNGVIVQQDVSSFIADGKNLFAKHVAGVAPGMVPLQEVYLQDEQGKMLGVGKTVLSERDMRAFTRGVAVKSRHGINKK